MAQHRGGPEKPAEKRVHSREPDVQEREVEEARPAGTLEEAPKSVRRTPLQQELPDDEELATALQQQVEQVAVTLRKVAAATLQAKRNLSAQVQALQQRDLHVKGRH